MSSLLRPLAPSKGQLVTGRVLSVLAGFFLMVDGSMKLVKLPPVMQAFARLGLPPSTAIGIGALLLVCTALYALPRTSVLGAVLLTGYLGGAVAIHLRNGDPVFPIVFPLLVGLLVWGGLYLREPRLRPLLPLRK